MFKKILFVGILIFSVFANAQNTFQAVIIDEESGIPLLGATAFVEGTNNGAVANEDGLVSINNIANGEQVIVISYVGFETQKLTLNFPLNNDEVREIFMHHEGEEIEVFITSTRSRRVISDLPTRVEVISGEELQEKGNMKPGNIRMLLNETTGIQTQQTSATSYNSSIRIQGLDGKYTQLLKDGYPLYSGFSGGLSLLQIVPLDLQQVEVIKGASSTLYGGGAIAGLVNLISIKPSEERKLNFLINGTSALGLDLSGFYAEKFKKWGTTVFASYNLGSPYDPADIGLSAIPKFRRYTINPRFYYYFNDRSTLDLGVNTVVEERTGGNIDYIEGNAVQNPYYERNNTERITTRAGFQHEFLDGSFLSLKNSLSFFQRKIEVPNYVFSGNQFASYNEASYNFGKSDFEWIIGLNLWVDQFEQDPTNNAEVVDYNHITYGGFVQNNWRASDFFSLESGLRLDYQNEYGTFVLPRLSGMFSFNDQLTARIGGGLGYKTPTIFTEDAERIHFQNVKPINVEETEAENSLGANFDVNYRGELSEEIGFTLNTLFFYTVVSKPLILTSNIFNGMEYVQPDGYIDTKGIETNVKLSYKDFKLFVGYTLADVERNYNGFSSEMPLVSTHRLNNVLMYEKHDNIKIGLEAYYFSPQKLNDGTTGQDYWIFGLMTEKIWEHFSIFLNFENFTDTRQTKMGGIYTGSISDPQFKDIFAPVDGFVINGGVKINL
ncbi:MAG TPA: TonB-dependent receptor [Aequorivita sp.]|nr:TonB-dependent receptor [Aequorivita sp.]